MARSVYASKLSWRRRYTTPESHLHPADPAFFALVNGLLTSSKELSSCKKPQVCQHANAKTICRRIGALSPLFEDVHDSGVWLPPSAITAFRELRTAFRNTKALIHDCRHTSVLLLLMEQDLLSTQFQNLNMSIASSLSSLPFDLLELCQETRELVSLVQKHAGTKSSVASLYIDPLEKLLQSEILSVLSAFEAQVSPDPDKLKHIFETLRFNNVGDCERELYLLENERERLKGDQQFEDIPNINSLISFIRYARCMLYGLRPEQQVMASCRRYKLECPSMKRVILAHVEGTGEGGCVAIPEDFRCPISLDLMVDPVTVATGQTYERAAIARWIEEGHTTCPKTGAKLLHNNLIPNSSLRRLIAQWCAENDYVLENVEKMKGAHQMDALPSTKAAMEATKLTAEFLVGKLSKRSTVEVERQAAHELRLMAKEGMDNRACVAAAGAVPVLAHALSWEDPLTQEYAVTALLNLSINDKNKEMIVGELQKIVAILKDDSQATLAARENAAATLLSLIQEKQYRTKVGAMPGAIEGALQLLREASPRGKRDAAVMLFKLAFIEENADILLMKGAVSAAIEMLENGSDLEKEDSAAGEVVMLLAVLARRPGGLPAVSAGLGRVLPQLVQLLSEGDSRVKECTVALLLEGCNLSEASGTGAALRQGLRGTAALIPSLRRLLVGGTSRAQRKAVSLIKLLQGYPL